MGLGLIGSLVLYAGVYFLSMWLFKPKIKSPNVKASGLDDFHMTRAAEGSVIPWVFGRVKITGNIVWYGDLVVEKQTQKVKSGKSSKKVTVGYHYYLSAWQTICMGPARVLKVYRDNKIFINSEINTTWTGAMSTDSESAKKDSTFILNKGDGNSNFSMNLEYFSPIPHVCSMMLRKVFCGSGTQFPNLEFVVQSTFQAIWADPSNGMNPANVIYYMLTDAGVNGADIDNTSFNAAATYWRNKSYGVNLVVGQQGKLLDKIEQILVPLGGFYYETAGKHYILPNNPADASYGHIQNDFIKFVISRRSWEDTVNDIKATYIEEDKDFSERTAVTHNMASINMLQKKFTQSYDLTLFRQLAPTQRRLAELIKTESYPYAEVEFVTGMKYLNLSEGQIVQVSNEELGISNLSLRIVKKSLENIDSNEISFHGIQVVELLFDEAWTNIGTGSSTWVRELTAPVKLTKQRIFELPRTAWTDQPVLLFLAARELETETSFSVYCALDSTNYDYLDDYFTFCEYATLQVKYEANTEDIDDSETGMLIKYFKDTYDVESFSRKELFGIDRLLIVDNEVMKFQTVTLNENGTVRLTGIIRGLFNTAKVAHNASAAVWIVSSPIDCAYTPMNNVIAGNYKFLPKNIVGSVAINTATAIAVPISANAYKPFAISRIYALRAGEKVSFIVSVVDMTTGGAGLSSSSEFITGSNTDVMIEWKLSTATEWTALPAQVGTFEIELATAFTVNVRAREFGVYTATKNLAVAVGDGEYVS